MCDTRRGDSNACCDVNIDDKRLSWKWRMTYIKLWNLFSTTLMEKKVWTKNLCNNDKVNVIDYIKKQVIVELRRKLQGEELKAHMQNFKFNTTLCYFLCQRKSLYFSNPRVCTSNFCLSHKPSWTFRMWNVIAIDPLSKKFFITPDVNSKYLARTVRSSYYMTFNGNVIRYDAIEPIRINTEVYG